MTGHAAVLDEAGSQFHAACAWAQSTEALSLTHDALEAEAFVKGRDIARALLQANIKIRALEEQRVEVVDRDGVGRHRVEVGTQRALATMVGAVTVERFAYRQRGVTNLFPVDAALNLPPEKYSHGLRRLTAIEAARGSFHDAGDAIERVSGVRIGKRQLEQLAGRAAVDFDAFYTQKAADLTASGDVIVLSCDGKGIVMRPDSLRPQTAKAAAAATNKIRGRLSKGEKANRKRMAELGAVYTITPIARRPADIITSDGDPAPTPGPTTTNKWLTASVEADAATVIASTFAEADRRDPDHQHQWIALVDGNQHQIDRITAEAAARAITVPIIIDIVHVIEYLWKGSWSFHREGDPAAQTWVRAHTLEVLAGRATHVAASITAEADQANLAKTTRQGADTCARYLTRHADHLDYPTALARGWHIATGIIEGACRHLVKDRMDITGARWGLHGAEAVLKLRALHANNDFDSYWRYHTDQELRRNHATRYKDDIIPTAA